MKVIDLQSYLEEQVVDIPSLRKALTPELYDKAMKKLIKQNKDCSKHLLNYSRIAPQEKDLQMMNLLQPLLDTLIDEHNQKTQATLTVLNQFSQQDKYPNLIDKQIKLSSLKFILMIFETDGIFIGFQSDISNKDKIYLGFTFSKAKGISEVKAQFTRYEPLVKTFNEYGAIESLGIRWHSDNYIKTILGNDCYFDYSDKFQFQSSNLGKQEEYQQTTYKFKLSQFNIMDWKKKKFQIQCLMPHIHQHLYGDSDSDFDDVE